MPRGDEERLIADDAAPDGIFVAPFGRGEIGPDLFRAACSWALGLHNGLPSTLFQSSPVFVSGADAGQRAIDP